MPPIPKTCLRKIDLSTIYRNPVSETECSKAFRLNEAILVPRHASPISGIPHDVIWAELEREVGGGGVDV